MLFFWCGRKNNGGCTTTREAKEQSEDWHQFLQQNKTLKVLEWKNCVEHLLSDAGLLHVTDLAASTIGNAGRCHFVVGNLILPRDVRSSNEARNKQFAEFKIYSDFLGAFDPQNTVWQDIDNGCRDPECQFFVPAHAAVPLARAC